MKEPQKSLKACVFERLDAEQVRPKPRIMFQTYECGVWALWLLSVLFGALAVAVTVFVLFYRQYALYEATHDNFFTFMVEALPVLWVLLFSAMVIFAVYNLRHTKRGYRYPLWQIFLSSLVFSFIGGAVLHGLGLGYAADTLLGQQLAMYTSQAKYERSLWQAPAEGRLVATFRYDTVRPTTTLIMEDVSGVRWTVMVGELQPYEHSLLRSGEPVRLLGATTNTTTKQFYACGAFSWMLHSAPKQADLTAERAAFVKRMYDHQDRVRRRLELAVADRFTSPATSDTGTTPTTMSRCTEMASLYRMPLRAR